MEKTIAQEAKEILSEVPACQFITGKFIAGNSPTLDSCGCAIGHFIMRPLLKEGLTIKKFQVADILPEYARGYSDDPVAIRRKAAGRLRIASVEFAKKKHGASFDIAQVNNEANCNGYTVPSIKDRVIHLLDDMIAAGY